MNGPLFRFVFSLFICCSLVVMLALNGPEESDGCSGHESGMLTINSQQRCGIQLVGPILMELAVGYSQSHPDEGSKTIKIRAGTYHWVALPLEGNAAWVRSHMRVGMLTVKNGETTVLNMPRF